MENRKGNAYCMECGYVLRDVYLITLKCRTCPSCGAKGKWGEERRSSYLRTGSRIPKAVGEAVKSVGSFVDDKLID